MLKTNSASFLAKLRKEPDKLKRKMLKKIRSIITLAHESITSKTPVYTGTALANYRWSIGSPDTSYSGDPGGGATGSTNSMPLGVEPRRAGAKAKADSSMRVVFATTNPFQTFYLSNNTPHIRGLEYGQLPFPPLNQRSPNGMFRVTLAMLAARLNAGAI